MSSNDTQLAWTEDQWNTVRRAVLETARKARVASSFLPLVGPLPASTTTVPALEMAEDDIEGPARGEAPQRLAIDESKVLRLATIATDVYLKTSEAGDPELAAALAMFCRAADVVARAEDSLIFNGMTDAGELRGAEGGTGVRPPIYTLHGGTPSEGLSGAAGPSAGVSAGGEPGERIVRAVVQAIQKLEDNGHYGPFACVLGNGFFLDANTPSHSLVLPSDRITPFLNGPLLRSSTLAPASGLVFALAGDPVDLVVATDITVKFLQLSVEPRYVFRVYERIAVRIKQPGAICRLMPHTKAG